MSECSVIVSVYPIAQELALLEGSSGLAMICTFLENASTDTASAE
ncbi:MAG: hypothetical protein ACK5ME_04630 [Parahaliea sp.]